ncbi:MAG: hypothetical protein EZS28_020327 [Streblomastix strix]|uniref:Uncharacterized protein n=1 Tax=Streblomastix strix TaxID=222440 RepID=A0A5J4VNG7_9EUKA|nr:MAG: hypothetical protein EZS28_020327 [Streblomastix strix]
MKLMLERKVNTYFCKPINKQGVIRNSQWISVLEPLFVASTIKLKWRETYGLSSTKQYDGNDQYKKIETPFGPAVLKTIYFDIRQGDDFITQWIEQIFEEAKQVSIDNKYGDETDGLSFAKAISYKQNVLIIGFNSSSFIGSYGQGKQIVVKHKQTKQQINFIDAMNYTQPTDLASFAKDFGNKDITEGSGLKANESKGLFPYEVMLQITLFDGTFCNTIMNQTPRQ